MKTINFWLRPTLALLFALFAGASAQAAIQNYSLIIQKNGSGAGVVSTTPSGIDCGATCFEVFKVDDTVAPPIVILSASPAPGSVFDGWKTYNGDGTTANYSPCDNTSVTPGVPTPNSVCTIAITKSWNVVASFTIPGVAPYGLTVTNSSAAGSSGTVTSNPGPLYCGTGNTPSCYGSYPNATSVTLTATAAVGSRFSSWSGADCSGTGPTCVVTMSAARSATANFIVDSNPPQNLSVTKTGAGSGIVSSVPAGIYCGASCNANFAYNAQVTLTAVPNSGSTFSGWNGCATTNGLNCTVTMDVAKTVTATFATTISTATLTVVKAGTGTGVITSSPLVSNHINCGTACTSDSADFPTGTLVALTAVQDSGSVFAGWGGACTGTGSCIVTMDAAKSVAATFSSNSTISQFTLFIGLLGAGTGTVSSTPAGIACTGPAATGTCSSSFSVGTPVVLRAVPGSGSIASGWTGCTNAPGASDDCYVLIDAEYILTHGSRVGVTATFTTNTAPSGYALTIVKTGTGAGTVASNPAGISCDPGCTAPASHSFTPNTLVALTATPAPGSTFAGWSGATCTGTGPCLVTMDAVKSVAAIFNSTTPSVVRTLIVTKLGMGTGSVVSTSVPASSSQVDCGGTCSVDFTTGATVTLTVTPGAGSAFAGWRGACSGLATSCVVTMETGKSVVASFDLNAIAVDKAGDGAGIVTSQPGGINCGSSCSAYFRDYPSVVLSAIPGSGSVFAGWSGPCSGTSAACTVGTSAPQKVNATFSKVGSSTGTGSYFAIFLNGTGSGAVSGSTGGINCARAGGTESGSCSATLANGTSLTLTAQPSAGSTFAGWSGACSAASSTCTLTMSAAQSVTASFNVSLSSQTITFGAAPGIVVGGTGTISATASSGLAVSFSSLTPGVCSVSGSTVSGLVAGNCTIAANQAGSTSINAAAQVTQTIVVASSFASVIEYYHAGFGHYFVTGSATEAAAIDSGSIKGWARTGQTYGVYSASATGLAPVCRFFSASFAPMSSHFYTPNAAECNAVKSNPNWQFETVAFYVKEAVAGVCASGMAPLYRVYNDGRSGAPNHRYTTCAGIVTNMVSRGWVSEGVTMCVPVGNANCTTDHSSGGVNYKAAP